MTKTKPRQPLPLRRERAWLYLAITLFTVAILYVLLSEILYLLSGPNALHAFPLIQGLKMLPPYADLRWIGATSECGVDLQAVADGRLWGCDPYGRAGSGYPPMSVQFARFLLVKGSHTQLIGFSMGLANVAIVCLLCFRLIKEAAVKYSTAALLVISLPMQLALERGNIDIVVFNLCASIAALAATNKRLLSPFLSFLSWLAVAVKLFPIAGLMAWISLDIFRLRRVRMLHVSVVLGSLVGILFTLPWILQGGASKAPQPGIGLISHGLRGDYIFLQAIANQLSFPAAALFRQLSHYWGAILYVLSLILGSKMRLYMHFTSLIASLDGRFARHFVYHFVSLTTCTWLAAYVIGGSFDYRMIFAMPGFICIFAYISSDRKRSGSQLFKIGLTLAMACILLSTLPLTFMPRLTSPSLLLFAKDAAMLSDYVLMPFLAGLLTLLVVPVASLGEIRSGTPFQGLNRNVS